MWFLTAAKWIGSGLLGLLKSVPWQAWLIGAVVVIAWRWHVNDVETKVYDSVYAQTYAVRMQWNAETVREDQEAIAERAKWQQFVTERETEREKFRADIAAESAAKQKARAAERRAVAALNEEVARDVLDNPSPDICVLSDNAYRLRTEQICAANQAVGRPCGATGEPGAGRLPRGGQGAPWWPIVAVRAPHGCHAAG